MRKEQIIKLGITLLLLSIALALVAGKGCPFKKDNDDDDVLVVTSGSSAPAVPNSIIFVQQPTNTIPGDNISPAVTVQVDDQYGQVVTGTSVSVTTTTLLNGTTTTITDASGIATFTDLMITTTGTYALSARCGAVGPQASSNFNITASTPNSLTFVQQPTSAATGANISPAVTVRVDDQYGNVVAGVSVSVTTTTLLNGTTTTMTNGSGIAIFADLMITMTGTYALSAWCGTVGPQASSNFDITAWPIISDSSSQKVSSITADADYLYIAGFGMGSSIQWRIEKRDKITGELVSAFDSDGVVTSNPTGFSDKAESIIADDNYLYIAGYADQGPSGGRYEWRIEKRHKITGGLVSGFGVSINGVVTSNPSSEYDAAYSLTADDNYLYIAGYANASGSDQWRIEKRNKSDGALVAGFGVAINGVVTSTGDYAQSIIMDDNYIYIAGYDNDQWRIEKRDKTTGDLVNAFDSDGVVISNPSGGIDRCRSLTADDDYLYLAGCDQDPGNNQWRIEKRHKITGGLVSVFGTNGVVTNNPSDSVDFAWSITADANYLYIVGYDEIPEIPTNNSQWRIEKRDKTTGVLVGAFGTGGVVSINPTDEDDVAFSVIADDNYLYIAGHENGEPGNPQWRIERRDKTTGGQ